MELQPYVFKEAGEGVFEAGEGRFAYTYLIRPIDVPVPEVSVQPEIPVEDRKKFAYRSAY
ncbi:MAG: hypothetical protein HOH77_00825, partial [Candidatus Latescibacteria bacterium]|nr:hypothetical protein [Candidatus Latescibacterota bacterium]